MKNIFVLFAAVSLFASAAFACHGGEVEPGTPPHVGDKTQTVCSKENANLCAFLWFQSSVDTETAAKFVVRMTTPDAQELSLVKVELWMNMENGHGHGSAPVVVDQVANNIFQITNAYFIMMGEWVVRIQFSGANGLETIEIPVYVGK